jgi:hypothetical protein
VVSAGGTGQMATTNPIDECGKLGENARSPAVRRANSLSAGVRLCRPERGFLRAEADDVGGNADLRSRP